MPSLTRFTPLLLAAGVVLCGMAVPRCADAAQAATAGPAKSDARILRLAALGKLWGQIRTFDPALATSEVDWDRALIEAIPRVNAARDAREYRRAVDAMLATLHDPATRTLDAAPAPTASPPRPGAPVSVRDGVAHADLAAMADAADADGSQAAIGQQLDTLADALKGATALVLDARAARPADQDHYTPWLLATLSMRYGNAPWRQGSLRYRSYAGYPSQTGSLSSGGYYAGFGTDLPTELPGGADTPLPRVVVITNARSAVPVEWLAGLRANRGDAWIAVDGIGDLGATPVVLTLADGVRAQFRTTLPIGPEGRGGVQPDAVVDAASLPAALAAALAGKGRVAADLSERANAVRADVDRPYAEMKFPGVEYRLLALFRFHTVIDTFFPYKPLIGPGWNDVLERYIPQFEANRDAADYQMTIRRLVTEPHDSHVGTRSGVTESADRLGRYLPPVQLGFVEGETTVTRVIGEGVGLTAGEVIEQVDGRPTAVLRDERASYTPASTPQALQRDVHGNLLRGPEHAPVRLGVRGLDGARRDVVLTREVTGWDPRWTPTEHPLPLFGVLPSGLGYVDLGRLKPAEVDAMFAAIAGTRATIFDMRGYPNGTAWPIAPRLGTADRPVAAMFRRPIRNGRDLVDPDLAVASLEFTQRVPERVGAPYLGKVLMLINEQTQSQAENTGLFFEVMTPVTYVGSPTAGANGDVTQMVLPGGIGVSFSGHDVRHADGRQLQRVGLVPDVRVSPTRAGLARNEDEVLAAAEAWCRVNLPAASTARRP